MRKKPDLTVVSQPQAFFHELITSALEKQRLKLEPETQFYLVNLLNQFLLTQNLFLQDSEGHLKEEPLALMIKDALEETTHEMQKLLFRKVGDVSLYTSGFFQESLNRKLVDLDYYINVGETAYGHVAARAASDQKKIFEELAHRFSALVDVLAHISDQTTPKTERNLFQLYDRFMKTGSKRAEQVLKDAGLIQRPTDNSRREDLKTKLPKKNKIQ